MESEQKSRLYRAKLKIFLVPPAILWEGGQGVGGAWRGTEGGRQDGGGRWGGWGCRGGGGRGDGGGRGGDSNVSLLPDLILPDLISLLSMPYYEALSRTPLCSCERVLPPPPPTPPISPSPFMPTQPHHLIYLVHPSCPPHTLFPGRCYDAIRTTCTNGSEQYDGLDTQQTGTSRPLTTGNFRPNQHPGTYRTPKLDSALHSTGRGPVRLLSNRLLHQGSSHASRQYTHSMISQGEIHHIL